MSRYIVGIILAVAFLVATNVRADVVFNTPAAGGSLDREVSQLYEWVNEYLGGNYENNVDFYSQTGVISNAVWYSTGDWQMLAAPTSAGVGMSYDLHVVDSIGNRQSLGSSGTTLDPDNRVTWNVNNLPAGTGAFSFELDVLYGGNKQYTLSSDPEQNTGFANANGVGLKSYNPATYNPIQMVAFDITDLYITTYGGNYTSVYLFGWEDLIASFQASGGSWWFRDNDYQDVFYIVANVTPVDPNDVPEPATLAILVLGLAGLGLARRQSQRRHGK